MKRERDPELEEDVDDRMRRVQKQRTYERDAAAAASAGSIGGTAAAVGGAVAGAAASEPPISRLPSDLLPPVFGLLDLRDRCRSRRVCRSWRTAALEPPHSPSLSLTLPSREVPIDREPPGSASSSSSSSSDDSDDDDECGPFLEALASAAFATSLRAALASPLASALVKASLALDCRPASSSTDLQRVWPLDEALRSLPASVTSLAIRLDEPVLVFDEEKVGLRAALRGLQETHPGLAELVLCREMTNIFFSDAEGVNIDLLHPTLERMDAGRAVTPREFFTQLPALTRLESLWVDRDTTSAELQQLAARNLRVRSLHLDMGNVARDDDIAAVSAMFRPADFDWPLPGLSRFRFQGDYLSLPFGGLPPGFGAGVQQVELRAVLRGSLSYLTEIASSPTLRKLVISRDAIYFDISFDQIRAMQVLEALQDFRDDLEITIRWPAGEYGWDVQDLDTVIQCLLSNREALVAFRLSLGDFLENTRRRDLLEAGGDGGVRVKQEPGGALGPRATAATLLAAEYHVARCEALAERRALLTSEIWELSRVRASLERLLREPAAAAAPSLDLQAAAGLLGRCRALGDGRWSELAAEPPPTVTHLDELHSNAKSEADAAALPVLAAKGYRTRALHLTGYDLADPVVASAAGAILDVAERSDGSACSLHLHNCDPPLAGSGFGAGAQRIIVSMPRPSRSVLPWIAEIARSPSLIGFGVMLFENGDDIDPASAGAVGGGVATPGPLELLEALRGCPKGVDIIIDWPADEPGWDAESLARATARLAAGSGSGDNLLVALHICGLRRFLDAARRSDGRSAPEPGPREERALLCAAEWLVLRCEATGFINDSESRELIEFAKRLVAVCQLPAGEIEAAQLQRARRVLGQCAALLLKEARLPFPVPDAAFNGMLEWLFSRSLDMARASRARQQR